MSFTLLDTAFLGVSTLIFLTAAAALVLFIVIMIKANKALDIWLKKNGAEPPKKD